MQLGDLAETEVDELLRSAQVGRLGCHAGGDTYVVPISYAFDGERVYAHSYEGRKLHMMRNNPEVCFEVDRYEDVANWRSVIAWGRFEELAGEEAERALRFIVEHLGPQPPGGGVFAVHLGARTGRFARS